jgi:hypothetical protein
MMIRTLIEEKIWQISLQLTLACMIFAVYGVVLMRPLMHVANQQLFYNNTKFEATDYELEVKSFSSSNPGKLLEPFRKS